MCSYICLHFLPSGENDDFEYALDPTPANIHAARAELNYYGTPVDVNKASCPFTDQQLDIFLSRLDHLTGTNPDFIPETSYCSHEWIEVQDISRAGRKKLEIKLPESVWRPRALLWDQAYEIMQEVLISPYDDVLDDVVMSSRESSDRSSSSSSDTEDNMSVDDE